MSTIYCQSNWLASQTLNLKLLQKIFQIRTNSVQFPFGVAVQQLWNLSFLWFYMLHHKYITLHWIHVLPFASVVELGAGIHQYHQPADRPQRKQLRGALLMGVVVFSRQCRGLIGGWLWGQGGVKSPEIRLCLVKSLQSCVNRFFENHSQNFMLTTQKLQYCAIFQQAIP